MQSINSDPDRDPKHTSQPPTIFVYKMTLHRSPMAGFNHTPVEQPMFPVAGLQAALDKVFFTDASGS